MEQSNLILTFKFKDGTPEATLNIHDDLFNFEYGMRDRWTEIKDLQVILSINGKKGVDVAQKFLFANYRNISNTENLKEIVITIFRPEFEESNATFVFEEGTFSDLGFIYTNNEVGNNQFTLSFNFEPLEG